MSDATLVSALESRLVNAWPSFESQFAEGWLIRFAKGYSKRANAATAIVPGATLDDPLIDHVVAQFEAQGLRPVFRLTSLEAPGADDLLAARGFVEIEPSFGMIADLDQALEIEPAVAIGPAPDRSWARAAARSYGGDKADDATLMEIVARIRQPTGFATLSLDEENVAWGLAVAERGYVGLYDIVVAPELRGLGLSRTLVTSLMAWGRGQGATQAYLQVRESNEVGRALYGSLGFADAYRYTHRVAP